MIARTRRTFRTLSVAALLGAALAVPALASAPRSPIQLDLKVTGLEAPAGGGGILIDVVCLKHDAPGTLVELQLPGGIDADEVSWKMDLRADVPVSLTTQWRLVPSKAVAGNGLISAAAMAAAGLLHARYGVGSYVAMAAMAVAGGLIVLVAVRRWPDADA